MLLTKDIMPGGNILILLMLSAGVGILSCLYGYEWYARVNCPPVLVNILHVFIFYSEYGIYLCGASFIFYLILLGELLKEVYTRAIQ
jgi:hypothetical protein